ncbi:TPA: tRNA pseudouridine(38-40) synthase TruA [Methanosarcina acetivorans]|jgi:tRNA pseudouridine38-40 synthase|uniref:tRNA pseudouridine synthase A n=2 Tax=Methanosarcina acetivorans TaxID=2214 RepID=TRUA_METAC|nr:tRNA pseudouridine(38-40) synthase TruA [Methanosarcina acetivorans]Q8TU65.1 RecName: Full=tRNA pseudouridine synthase A; AltName: Full=tRNA pseudouridine(38-40) synthase; AltName: Full=tRNA pseudouridylate synthase I; AltName: Full=tRNA-uridine isomerase I [Methanosarcina acetivorans C2A]AAM03661.1 pseudouridylate synthase [Methanosarcina acetivorans C2A]HIH94031.1 tRNA pseudouridine(38-40) synthase TruA [Methanosarcina acetivorans]
MRVALKLAYIGTEFHGSQIQPNVETVEKELFKALRNLSIIESPKSADYTCAGRTDAGVHALGQVVAFDTEKPNLAIPRVINSELPPAIWAWAHAEVPYYFDARRSAVSRHYHYVMSGEDYDISKMREASKLLLGTHDFENFSRSNGEKSTVRTLERINVRVDGEITKIDVVGNSFLWNMVRKIVTALSMIGNGVRDNDWLLQMLNPEIYEEGIEPAPPYGLTLMGVNYGENIEWIEDDYSIRRAGEQNHKRILRHRVMAEVLEELISHE